jgi:hypothetical protein
MAIEAELKVRDADGNDIDTLDECPCGPTVECVDPDSGVAHDEPLVIHHSLDGREHVE